MTHFAMEKYFPLEQSEHRSTALLNLSAGDTLPMAIFDKKRVDNKQVDNKGVDNKAICDETICRHCGIELLIIEGCCEDDEQVYSQGYYLRLPDGPDTSLIAKTDCILFIKYNQFLDGDNGCRTIDTRITDHWLPGPADGIEIRPLHVYDTESIMLLRWNHAAEFRPKLNPRGEEILVVNGLLQNRDHLYRQFSWIRNPIEDWRKWHGNTGTLAYYKSGHFPDDPIRYDQAP